MAQAIVQSSCTKLRSAIGDKAMMHLNFTGDLEEMLDELEAIHAVIPDAEYRWMVTDKEHCKDWLMKVKDAAYGIYHMLDELEDTRTTLSAGNKARSMAKMLIHPANVIVEPSSSKQMSEKMKDMKEKLKMLQNKSVHFDVRDIRALLQAQAATVGRQEDKDKILARLSECHSIEGPIILLIRGVQKGIGKATVAAMVFDDDRFKCYSRVWINHSHMLGLHEIGKYIISQVSSGEEETIGRGSKDNMVHITNRLHELLNGKKVLLVLHNLWDDASQWKRLKDMLSVGGMGSTQVIVIATVGPYEQDTVANGIFGVEPYCLHPLTEEMCRTITKQVAGHSQDKSGKEYLEQIAPEVAKLCDGIPLADTVGRQKDKEGILARLSECHSIEGPIILLIRGEEKCIGKATAAAMVFDDDRFKCYSLVWINHSHMLGLHEIGKYIISQVSAGEEETISHGSKDNMVHMTNRLHELLNGKKVLLVLHNLWDDASQWKRLKDMLSVGGMGSTQVIIIATVGPYEQDTVANGIFGVEPYCLHPLTEEMCRTIIKQVAGHSQDKSGKEYLEQIAPEVAKLCDGIPLAAQLFGSVLQFKEYREWPQLLDSEAFKTSSPVDRSLELCYRSMPPNLRLCFTYCAFFAKERSIVKEDLIHQWIALDLIEPSEAFSTTQLAEQYIRRLLDMSLLQMVKLSWTSAKDDKCAISFTMHEEVREFAANLIRGILDVVEEGRRSRHTEHCSYALVFDFADRPLESIFPDQKIRALRCLGCSKVKLGNDSFSFARCLRVLELHECSMQKLPESICQLRHLGYLKLSGWSGLVTLPESIGGLINLLHIDLSACSRLANLPGSFGKLINLVHVSLSGCSKLANLPESFGKLINLVHIDLSGSGLVQLPETFGKLTNLVHIKSSGCISLVNLPESFGRLTKLEHINVSACPKLVGLPGAFGKLTNLVHINLSGCPRLVNLPGSFGKLTNLGHINLSGCCGLEELPQSFGKLIRLVHINLSGCSGLATLPGSFGDQKKLLHADLSRCHVLIKLPESFGNLKKLVHLDLSFWSCFEGIQTALGGLNNLQHLNLSHPSCYRADYPHLQGLKEVLGHFIRLKHLNLSMFLNPIFCNQSEEENRKYTEFISGFPRLEYLDLSHNIFLRELPERLDLDRLHTIDLSGCIRLKKLEKWMPKMQRLKSVVLTNLESYKFVVSRDDIINNYRQLVDVRCKKLKITCLEKMMSVDEAQRMRLAEKQNLRKLKLCWTMNSEQYVEDKASLEKLVPPHSLQQLELHGYWSEGFPGWLASPTISSLNLVEVTLQDIPWCNGLPKFGLLPNLQQVVLRRMYSITKIDAGELSGGSTSAFNRLSKFTIDDMGSLEEFTYHSSGGKLFPVIAELVVRKCPKLSFVPLPPRARRLVVSDCNVVMVCWQNRGGRQGVEGRSCMSSPVIEVTELVVESCIVYLSHWCLLNHLPGLRSLTIKNCYNIISSPQITGILSSLEILCFSQCKGMRELPEHLGGFRSLRELHIECCIQLEYLPDSMKCRTSLESTHSSNSGSIREIPPWSSLQKLTIEKCTSIGSLPPSIGELTNLKDLHISGCTKLDGWCEKEENKKILGHFRLIYEATPTSEPGQQVAEIEEDDLQQSD